MPENIKATMQQLATGGSFDMTKSSARVEHYGDRIEIPTTKEASEMLDNIIDLFDEMAYQHKERTGLEALPMRGYEQVSKVSLILAVPICFSVWRMRSSICATIERAANTSAWVPRPPR